VWVLFVGLGGACLWLRAPEAYLVAALAWLGAVVARVAVMGVEHDTSKENAAGIVVGGVVGALFLVGVFYS
jgi:hypothetical protein